MTADDTLRSADRLVAGGLLPEARRDDAAKVVERYAIAITPAMAALIDPADPADPIARQFLPDPQELIAHPAERADPIGDHDKSPVKGLVHRYADRVLIKIVGVCPVYCRFCFRREMVGPDAGVTLSSSEVADALDYVRDHPGITEVILTGGDPFMLSARRARAITDAIGAIPHVSVVRWHTRVPAAAPARLTDDFAAALRHPRLHVIAAVHINHAAELTPAAAIALERLGSQGIRLLSQSVLLRGVNDDIETLERLMVAVAAAGVRPYYLHHGDLAPGTSHFRLPLAEGMRLSAALAARVGPLAAPRYVLDIPGGFGKITADAPFVVEGSQLGEYVVTDRHGATHTYRDALL